MSECHQEFGWFPLLSGHNKSLTAGFYSSFSENRNNSSRVDVFYMNGVNLLLDQHHSEHLECYPAFLPHISILLIIYILSSFSSFMWKHLC